MSADAEDVEPAPVDEEGWTVDVIDLAAEDAATAWDVEWDEREVG